MSNEIVAYQATEAALTDLASRYKDMVFDVTVPKGMQEAKAAYKDINTHSIVLEAARVKEKAESLAYGRFVDSEAARIAQKLDVLRLPIKAQIETETKRAEREQEARIKAEQDRILAEQAAAKAAEERRMAEQRAEIAKQQAAVDKAARESRAKIEAEERAARLRIEEAERQERLARQAREEVERVKRASEEAALKAERDRIEAERRVIEEAKRREQAEAEAKAKAIRDAAEAKQRAIRLEALAVADARGALRSFRSTYGHRQEFAKIIAAIDEYMIAVGEPA